MVLPQRFIDPFRVPEDDPSLAMAQAAELAKQIPVLHTILSAGAIAIAYTHYGIAPDWLTIYPLAVLLPVCSARILTWRGRSRAEIRAEGAIASLKGTTRMAGILGGAFAGWALALSRYGDSTLQMHVLFFLTITMIACISCLMHLRSAAYAIGVIAVPLTIHFCLSDSVVVATTALNFAAVICVMLFMQAGHYKNFRNLVRQYEDLGRLSAENSRLANMDTLTGLPNRRSFFARLEATIGEARRTGTAFAVGMIDLDGFKPVNDTYGHAAGDQVLREVGERLNRAMAEIGWAARLGGDEFGLIVERSCDVGALGTTLRVILEQPYALRGATAEIGASIGFASYPEAGDDAEILVERADYALYYAKAHHRGTAVAFTHEHEARLRRHSVIEQALRHADLDAEFGLVYQPIVDTASGHVVAFEALARWTSPRLGTVSPGDFITVAERAGLIHELSRVLLRKALAAARLWPEEVRLSFNLSTEDLGSDEAVARIAGVIDGSGVPAGRIMFEVTETAMMRNVRDAQKSLLRLKEIGVALALDDFGTGYSSLSYVHRLPLDKLKIDRAFITDLATDQACRDIVKSVIDLCRNLRLICVAEGIETAEQMMILRALGCFKMQGYFLHKPMPEAMIAGFLEGRAREAASAAGTPTAKLAVTAAR